MIYMGKRVKIYLIIVIIAAAAVFMRQWRIKKQTVLPVPTTGGIGSDIYQKAENPGDKLPEVNPLGNKPDVNPLSDANPFKFLKTNPFK